MRPSFARLMELSGLLPLLTRARSLKPLFGDAARRLVVGLPDAVKPPMVAAIASAQPRPALFITARSSQAEALVEEIAAWADPRMDARLYPRRDTLPYDYLTPDLDTVRQRLSVLSDLHSGKPELLIVTSITAVAQPTLKPEDLDSSRYTVRVGDRLRLDEFMRRLDSLGYQVEPMVDRPGVASRRGGIIDVYPAHLDDPVRIELFGDEVESLRSFDPSTQRSQQELTSFDLATAREIGRVAAAAKKLHANLDFNSMDDEARERWTYDLELLEDSQWFPQEPYYASFLAQGSILDFLAPEAVLVMDEVAEVEAMLDEQEKAAFEARIDHEDRGEIPRGLPLPLITWATLSASISGHRRQTHFSRWTTGEEGEGFLRPPFATPKSYAGNLPDLIGGAQGIARLGTPVVIASQQAQRIAELFRDEGVQVQASVGIRKTPEAGALAVIQGALRQGWTLADEKSQLTLLTDAEIFGFRKVRRAYTRRKGGFSPGVLPELSPGDFVVHIDHGVARFAGTVRRSLDEREIEYLELHYAEGDKIYVPVDQVDRVARYVGPGEGTPQLTRLGSQEWQRSKERVRRAVAELAQELLELYASRELAQGYAFDRDTPWQMELEASFPYVETPDQLTAVREVKADMERQRPMDRLVCGDVGYGKTEVAIRAAFKSVLNGKQVGFLVPTTVLAQQHFNTFKERLAGFPVKVEMLSRFRSPKEQKKIVELVSEGEIDILIGTHRLLSKDVKFKDLGLVVIDEEQRFGVAHKERLKRMRSEVDVLTLSATPIPRTLHMSLTGIRDMSTIETAPEARLPIKTYVSEFDDHVIREAILRELDRGGQIYLVHNRVRGIEQIATHVRKLVPQARIGVGHGQMPEELLERVMLQFAGGEVDVLICTTIIESGLDIPNANTIIINRADMMGLSQLYQLRGRVGRGGNRAYAYLLFDEACQLSEIAQRRLQTVFEAQELGAGFQIAMKDLEIRGAGNLLGAEQSGHIGAVGFDLYTRLLREQVERVRALRDGNEPPRRSLVDVPIQVELPVAANIPESYIPDMNLRLSVYKRLADVTEVEKLPEMEQELRDRFGEIPGEVEGLLYIVRVRALGRAAGVKSIKADDHTFTLQMSMSTRLDRSLQRDLPPNSQVGPTQVRLDRPTLGGRWQERVIEALERLVQEAARLEEAAATPAS
ncbi:MAG: transcription-repair coupling factor [Dehalococcoidia bacterium]